MKRLLIGIKKDNVIIQSVLLPERVLCLEYLIEYENGIIGGIRWNTEKSRKNFVWYKNLRFNCNIKSKDNWSILDLDNMEEIFFMRNGKIFKDINDFKIHVQLLNNKQSSIAISDSEANQNTDNQQEKERQYALQLFNKYTVKYGNLYFNIQDKELFKEELIECIICNYINSEDDEISVYDYFEEDVQEYFENFIFAEKHKANIQKELTYEFVIKHLPKLKNKDKNLILQAIEIIRNDDEYFSHIANIDISINFILYDIEKNIEIFENSVREEEQQLLENIEKEKRISEFENYYDKFTNTYQLEKYHCKFYCPFENGKIINVDDFKIQRFEDFEKYKIALSEEELLEFELIYKVLKPIILKFIVGKKQKAKPIVRNLDSHINYFNEIIKLLYQHNIIKDENNKVSINTYENFNNFKEDCYKLSTKNKI